MRENWKYLVLDFGEHQPMHCLTRKLAAMRLCSVHKTVQSTAADAATLQICSETYAVPIFLLNFTGKV